MVLITRVNRVPNSGFNNGDLTSWTPLGGATVTAVNNLSWRARVTFPASAPAGTAGIQVPLKDLTPGVASRVWASVPAASGSTTVKIQISDSGGMGGGNLLPNPGFEVDASGWTGATRTTTTPHTGVACGAISTSMSTPSGTSGIPVSASTSYYVEGWAFSVNANATATVTVAWFNAGGSLISTTSMTPVALSGRPWTQVAPGIITSPGTAAFAQVIGTKTGGFGSLLFDDMWFGPAGAPAAVGAAFATNEPLFKVGALNHTPVSSTATLQIVNAVTAGAADWVEIDYALYDDGTTTSYPFFDGSYPGAHWEGSPVSTAAVFEGYDTEVSDRPVAVVEIDARPITSMDFVLDRDALDNPSVAPIDSPRWVAVPETKSVSINRGRDNEEQEIGPGTATIVLDDYDGVYDPDNYHSPLQTGKGYQAIHSGMGVRVSALAQSLGTLVPIPMFTGSLDDTSIDRTWEPLMTLSAVDDISKINNADIPPFDPAIGDGSTTLYRALWALGYAGLELWDASFGTALTRQMLATSGGGNVGSHLRDVAACEGGKVYVKADGTLHIGTHADDFAYTPAATFTDDQQANGEVEYDDIQTSTSIGRIINRCIITRGDPAESTTGEGSSGPATGAEAVTAQDDESIAFCGRVFSETVEVPLYNWSDAEAMAVWRATRRSRTATRVDSVKFSMHSQPLAWQVLALDLSNVVRVRRQAWNRTLDGTYAVEGIAWEIIAGGSWTGEVKTSPLQINSLYSDGAHPFFIGTSLLDGPDIIAAY